MGLSRKLRVTPPAHYTVKMDSFSLISTTKLEKYVTGMFEAGGYSWKLSLYPNGDTKRDGKGHISLFLSIAEQELLPQGWEVNVNFKMFVFDHNEDKYLAIQDEDGKVWRYHGTKSEWGFSKLLSLDELNDTSKGYLSNDSFVFGVEIFVVENTGRGETFSKIENPENGTYSWPLHRFSTITRQVVESPQIVIGGHKWVLQVRPKGTEGSKGTHMSLHLKWISAATSLAPHPHGRALYAAFKLRVKDQIRNNNSWRNADHWFTPTEAIWGYSTMQALSDINDISKGFVSHDTLIAEVQILGMSQIKDNL